MENWDDLFSMTGKRALVTGASRGIGRAIALAFARAGADVAVLARSTEELDHVAERIRSLDRRAIALPCDVFEPDQIGSAVDRVLGAFGTLDVLVNNAGGPVFNSPFLAIRPDGFLRVVELNLMSVVHFCQAVGEHMVGRRSGSIINVDSIGATHPAPLVTPYCAAKAAVVNLSQALAQEWASAAVRVNCISPGLIDTEINRALVAHPEHGPTMANTVPLGRWGSPDDLVGAAVWLASDAAAYVTGAVIPINGGLGGVAPQALPTRSERNLA
jgi:NAD(P)-dependent dehydrogenase (short-subunit alcohol dehydrogenase family)